MKRIFIAIELPRKIKAKLTNIQKNFSNLKAKWVKPEHLHMTLVFLGNIAEQRISEIEKNCSKNARKFSTFKIEFIGLGAFPNSTRPHTLWVAVKDSENLIQLQRKLSQGLRKLGFQIEDRQFSPHLTLARLKKRSNLKEQISKYQKVNFGKMIVGEFDLFESQLFAV